MSDPSPRATQRPVSRVLAVVAAVAVVAAAFGVTLVVSSDDKDGPPDVSTAPTTASTPATTSAPVTRGDDTVVGDGYAYDLPDVGWTDATTQAGSVDSSSIDTLIVMGSSIGVAQSNIVVEALGDGGATSIDDLEDLWKRNLAEMGEATPIDIDQTAIAGEPAIGVRIDDRVNDGGVAIRQIVYLTLHAGRQFSIALSFPALGDSVSETDFTAVLESWTWTS